MKKDFLQKMDSLSPKIQSSDDAKSSFLKELPEEASPFLEKSPNEEGVVKVEIVSTDEKNGRFIVSKEKFLLETEAKVSGQNGHGREGERKHGFCGSYTGILLALFAGFIFTLGTILVKYLKHYHPFTLAAYRIQGIMIPSFFMVFYTTRVKKIPVFEPIWPPTEHKKAKTLFKVWLRSTVGFLALYLHLYALQYLQIADVAIVSSCKPICVTIAAFLLLGEPLGVVPILTALFAMVGVSVITRPPILTGDESFDMEMLVGVGFAIVSILGDTMVVVIVRSLKNIHVSVMMMFVGTWGSCLSILLAYLIGELKLPQSGTDWALAGGMAAVAILNQACMHLALQYEQAAPVSITRTMDFIFAFILQFFIMAVSPDLFSLTGAMIIIMCVLLTAFRKWLTGLPKTHEARKRFWFVLY